MNGMDTVGCQRSVGWSVDRSARVPVDHTGVGLAQGHPN